MRTYYDSKASKTLEPRLFGALGHELATGPSVFFFFFFFLTVKAGTQKVVGSGRVGSWSCWGIAWQESAGCTTVRTRVEIPRTHINAIRTQQPTSNPTMQKAEAGILRQAGQLDRLLRSIERPDTANKVESNDGSSRLQPQPSTHMPTHAQTHINTHIT